MSTTVLERRVTALEPPVEPVAKPSENHAFDATRELKKLERIARDFGMAEETFREIEAIGVCDEQVQLRNMILKTWISDRC